MAVSVNGRIHNYAKILVFTKLHSQNKGHFLMLYVSTIPLFTTITKRDVNAPHHFGP